MHNLSETIETSDVPESKQLENILENKDLIYTIFDAFKDGVTLSDESGYFWIFNSAMEKLTGYTREEANACQDFTVMLYPNPEDRQRALDGLNKIVNPGDFYETETIICMKNRVKRSIFVSTTLILYKGHKMFLSVYRDIIKSEYDEEEIRKKITDLERYKKATVDREIRMIELKKEVNELCEKLGEKPRYNLKKED
ncbi:MAG TPA: PAS domain S-box protein [Thermoplasmatales archaeon]|nr:PAS domain S-box protein [Thermoplasmatales archaeon]